MSAFFLLLVSLTFPVAEAGIREDKVDAAYRFQVAVVDVAKAAGIDAGRWKNQGNAQQWRRFKRLSDIAARCAWQSYSEVIAPLKEGNEAEALKGFDRISFRPLQRAWKRVRHPSPLLKRLYRNALGRHAELHRELGRPPLNSRAEQK